MINVPVVDGGDVALVSVLYPNQYRDNAANYSNALQSFSKMVGGVSDTLVKTAYSLHDRFYGGNAQDIARQAQREVAEDYNLNVITPIRTLDECRYAGEYNQKWIMANRQVRDAVIGNEIDGYSDTYIDPTPDLPATEHQDHHSVMDGLVVYPNSDDVNHWRIDFYTNQHLEGASRLHIEDVSVVLDTWNVVTRFLDEGEDPTLV